MPAGCMPVLGGRDCWELPHCKTLSTAKHCFSVWNIFLFPSLWFLFPPGNRTQNGLLIISWELWFWTPRVHIQEASLTELYQLIRAEGWGCQHPGAAWQASLLCVLVVLACFWKYDLFSANPSNILHPEGNVIKRHAKASCLFLATIILN